MRGEMVVAFALVMVLWLSAPLEAQLQLGFYSSTCPVAEYIVRDEVSRALNADPGLAAGLVRMHFHDCFVRGCDGSVLIDSTSTNTAEKDSPPNNPSLRGFEVIDRAKARIEAMCKGVVSCADIVAFAARDSVELAQADGGMSYQVPSGRRDGRVSLALDALMNLPPPTFNLSQLTQSFASKGLTQDEMVILSGAHTFGRAHCPSINNRLYNFNSTTSQDPSLDPMYASMLKQQCPQGSNDSTLVVPLDPGSPDTLDTNYYGGILMNRALFTSDLTLLSDNTTAMQVRMHAFSNYWWLNRFAEAMVKMGQIGVLTGSDGEIRRNCSVIN